MMSGAFAYARSRMKDLGFEEWTSGFTFVDIPRTKLDKMFHLEFGRAAGSGNNQRSQIINVPFSVRVFKSPRRTSKDQIDESIALGDKVVANFMDPANRLRQTEIKDAIFNAMTIESLSKTNDNGVAIKIDFTALVVMATG